MADLVNEMLGKFMALAQEEKQISSEMDAAFKEYNDYCSSSDEDLNKKIGEIHEKMHKLDYLLDYAKEHAQPDGLEEAPAPFETSAGQLESIRQTIKLDSHNDPNAETLYTKVTGQIKFYEQKIEQTSTLAMAARCRQSVSTTATLPRSMTARNSTTRRSRLTYSRTISRSTSSCWYSISPRSTVPGRLSCRQRIL